MKFWATLTLAGGAMALATMASAADLPSKKGPAPAAQPNCYESFWSWMNSSAADCPLSYWGVTFYGQIDVGAGYSSNAARLGRYSPSGVQELISGQSHGARVQLVPNGLSQSNLGVKWKEPLLTDWFFIGDVNFGFDPYTMHFADGPRTLQENQLKNGWDRSANGDSSRTVGALNSRAYLGVQNKTLGMLTWGRMNSLAADNIGTYDPLSVAYAFSPLGASGTFGGGIGDTELGRLNNALRYYYKDHGVHFGAQTQIGGYNAGNEASSMYQVTAGFDFQGFSIDGLYSRAKDAITLGFLSNAALPSTLKATAQDIQAGQVAAKYKWEQFQIMGGYQIGHITNPTNLPAGVVTRRFNLDSVEAQYGVGVQGSNAYPVAKNLQVFWLGGKWAALPTVDVSLGYYHVLQNNYLGTTETATSCAPIAADPQGHSRVGPNSGKCAGSLDAISGVIDWRIYKRLDLYAGAMYSKGSGGLVSGYYADKNLALTSGLRFSF